VIVLDTNVLSELVRSEPAAAVFAWVSAQPRAALYTTSVGKSEILHGIAVLPEGRRRLGLAAAAEAVFADDFEGRVPPFDARRGGDLGVQRLDRAAFVVAGGENLGVVDSGSLIAGAGVATRDTGNFAGCGLTLVNPWELP
jgi:predicted nucleic acid-binding protein